MAMRYIFRRNQPENYSDIQKQFSDLPKQLGTAGENYRRTVKVAFDSERYAVFQFFTRKQNNAWVWVCPSVELVADNEAGLFKLTTHFGLPRPSHLAHLPA